MIRHIRHQEIDKDKWNNCICQSGIDLEYAHAWYLNVVCPGWDALVMHDYEAVMPLTGNRKIGISYLFQPFFTQQLGVFSTAGYSVELVDSFLDAIPDCYKLVDIRINEFNHPEHNSYQYTAKKNYTLKLEDSYDVLYRNFSRNCRRNIKKGENVGLMVKTGMDPGQFAQFVRIHLSDQLRKKDAGFINSARFLEIIRTSLQRSQGEILSVHLDNKSPLAAGWFLKSKSRLFFQACASAPEGKHHEAMYVLVNHMIKQHASSGLIFDFMGSVLPGVEYFNASFGATAASYLAVHSNRLPKIARMFKSR